MARADHDPAQAEADMQRLQAAATTADTARGDAQEHVDRIEREIDTAFEAGDDSEVSRLQEQHQRAETALAAAEEEYESAMDEIGSSTTFWYVEDVEEDDED